MNDLLRLVNEALRGVYEKDRILPETKANERCIVFRFGLYFHALLQDSEYSKLDFDLEYNRNAENQDSPSHTKGTESSPNGVIPDAVLHSRGNNDTNVLVMEFKPAWRSGDIEEDLKKLEDFTNPAARRGKRYGYGLGLSIVLGKSLHETTCQFVRHGRRSGKCVPFPFQLDALA
jgi:hypothetical protein